MSTSTGRLLDFMMLIGKLKTTVRTGWMLRNVPNPESVGDHMYRMAAMAFLLEPSSGLDKDRCIKMSLVHDMAECIVGDLTPSCGVSKEEKHKKEKEAMDHIISLTSEPIGKDLFSLWQEYEKQCSPESHFVKDLDRFEMILQAQEYEESGKRPGELQEFFDTTNGKFQTPQVKHWVEELYERRKKFLDVPKSN